MSVPPPLRLPAWLSALAAGAGVSCALLPIAGACLAVVTEKSAPGLTAVFSDARVLRLLGKSFQLAGTAALLSAALGLCAGCWLSRFRPFQRLGALLLLSIPFFLSPVVMVTGSMWVMGPAGFLGRHLPWNLTHGLSGPALLLALMYLPLVASLVSFTVLPRSHELRLAGQLSMGRPKEFALICLPLVLPFLVGATLVVWVLSFTNYVLPSICRQNVLSCEVFLRFSAYYDLPTSAVVSFLLAGPALLALFAARCLLPDRPLSAHRETCSKGPHLVIAFSLLVALLPLSGQLSRLPSPHAALAALSAHKGAMVFSLLSAACGASLAFLGGGVLALHACFGKVLRHRVWELLGLLPLALPPPLLAVGLITLLNRPGLRVVLDSFMCLPLGYAIQTLPYAFFLLLFSLRSIPREELQAFSLARRTPLLFLAGRLAPHCVCTYLLCFARAFGEADLPLLLAPAGMRPLPVVLYNLYHFGTPGEVAVLALVTTCIIVVCLGAVFSALAFAQKHRATQEGATEVT